MNQFSNYPAGVTDAHPEFNPPEEVTLDLLCEAEEMELIPSYWVKAQLLELRRLAGGDFKGADYKGDGGTGRPVSSAKLVQSIDEVLEKVYELEDNGSYDCPFDGVVTLPVSEEAEWDCEICGTAHKVDTVPEERDPDEGWDGRHE